MADQLCLIGLYPTFRSLAQCTSKLSELMYGCPGLERASSVVGAIVLDGCLCLTAFLVSWLLKAKDHKQRYGGKNGKTENEKRQEFSVCALRDQIKVCPFGKSGKEP